MTKRPSQLRLVVAYGLLLFVLARPITSRFPWLTAFATSADRTLYFKLPIEGTEFHWVFLDREAFLAGELTLRIINKQRDETLVVFRDGNIQDGWKQIDDGSRGGAYFGFSTDKRIRTRSDDSLIVTLKATQDLLGRGPDSEGVLSAGVWQMSGTYSAIYGGRLNPLDLVVRFGEPPIAFMECWAGVWPIKNAKHEGWMREAPQRKVSFLRTLIQERGTNGRFCRSHIATRER